jgi:DNA-binding winged helix-turn-helix (wHTH) protein
MSIDTFQLRSLPLAYRELEVKTIARLLDAGESCSIIGVSGMAKSNLFRHLLSREVRKHYLGVDWANYLVVAVDFNALPETTERAAYCLLIEKVITESMDRQPTEKAKLELDSLRREAASLNDEVSAQSAFARTVRSVMASESKIHLTLLLDQFDGVCRSLSPMFFGTLRAIRDEHKYLISYVTFTRDEMTQLCKAAEFEEFYELFSPNVVSLGPYCNDDALGLTARVSGRYRETITQQASEYLIELSGGHPGLLKAGTLAVLQGRVSLTENREDVIDILLEVHDVTTECSKLWNSLSAEERECIHELATGSRESCHDRDLDRRLRVKKLIGDHTGGPVLFSPIFAGYASRQMAKRASQIKIQAGPIRIDSDGEVWVDGQQVVPPLSKKELLLLQFLCLNAERLLTKDEVIAVVYPDEYKLGNSVSDEALARLVQRTRERIRQFSGGREYVATVRGKGYRLSVS